MHDEFKIMLRFDQSKWYANASSMVVTVRLGTMCIPYHMYLNILLVTSARG